MNLIKYIRADIDALKPWQIVVCAWPLLLVFTMGGLVILPALVAFVINLKLMRDGEAHPLLKAVLILLVGSGAAVIFVMMIAVLATIAPQLFRY